MTAQLGIHPDIEQLSKRFKDGTLPIVQSDECLPITFRNSAQEGQSPTLYFKCDLSNSLKIPNVLKQQLELKCTLAANEGKYGTALFLKICSESTYSDALVSTLEEIIKKYITAEHLDEEKKHRFMQTTRQKTIYEKKINRDDIEISLIDVPCEIAVPNASYLWIYALRGPEIENFLTHIESDEFIQILEKNGFPKATDYMRPQELERLNLANAIA